LTFFISGCGQADELDATYGRSRGESVNGTGVLAAMFRAGGAEVRSAVRLTPELSDWADAIVRFSPRPGAPGADEADWYDTWLAEGDDRALIYIPHSFDAEADYWSAAIASAPPKTDPARLKEAQRRLDAANTWPNRLPEPANPAADPDDWFGVSAKAADTAAFSTMEGPWAVGVDAKGAALFARRPLEAGENTVLLRGRKDGPVLALEWHQGDSGRVLGVADGSFLLNAALLNRARRPLATQVVRWAGVEGNEPRHVAFVEGSDPLDAAADGPKPVYALLEVAPFGWVAGHLLALGLIACLVRTPRLGRPRPSPSAHHDRPAAHPEALGDLMARSRDESAAHAILDAYRAWRDATAPKVRRRQAPADATRPR